MKLIIPITFFILFIIPINLTHAKENNSISYVSKHGFQISVDKDFKMDDSGEITIFETRNNITTQTDINILSTDISFDYDDDLSFFFKKELEEFSVENLNELVELKIDDLSKDPDFKDLNSYNKCIAPQTVAASHNM